MVSLAQPMALPYAQIALDQIDARPASALTAVDDAKQVAESAKADLKAAQEELNTALRGWREAHGVAADGDESA